MGRWLVCMVWSWGVLCILAMVDLPSASAQSLSFSVNMSQRVRARGAFLRLVRKQIRLHLIRRGFGVMRGYVRKGFHLNIRVSVAEELASDEPASCAVQFQGQVIMMPGRRLVISSFSSSGSGRYNRAAKINYKRLMKLRKIAVQQAARYLAANVRRMIRQIEAKLQTLKKGEVLGKRVRFFGGGGGRRSSKGTAGKPLPGRTPVLRFLPLQVDIAHACPPYRPEKK